MHLLKQKTQICGTLHGDRKGTPKNIVKKKLKKAESVWKRSDHVVCQRNDKGNMLTISNKHSVEMVQVPNKHGQLTIKPNIVCDYSNDISGVDQFDQMLTYCQGLRKCIQ